MHADQALLSIHNYNAITSCSQPILNDVLKHQHQAIDASAGRLGVHNLVGDSPAEHSLVGHTLAEGPPEGQEDSPTSYNSFAGAVRQDAVVSVVQTGYINTDAGESGYEQLPWISSSVLITEPLKWP